MNQIIEGDNAAILPRLPDASFRMIYIDPPFNTGSTQTRDATGFAYSDSHADYAEFLRPRLEHAHRLLDEQGTLYFHIDYREAHRCKLLLDEIFGERSFLNEIIWAYDYGGRPKRRWPAKHDTILVYVRDRDRYYFDAEEVEREPYMAPGLVGPEKAARGKLPTDVWWHTIVHTNGAEKTGYPTQKPEGIVRRMVSASTAAGDRCLDFFAGSGTLGSVAAKLGREFILIDSNPDAIAVMERRLGLRATRSDGGEDYSPARLEPD